MRIIMAAAASRIILLLLTSYAAYAFHLTSSSLSTTSACHRPSFIASSSAAGTGLCTRHRQLSRQQASCLQSTASNDEATTTPTTTSIQKQLHLYNSLTRSKTPFEPLSPPHVSMYTCGPTVYDSAHVGNFRAFLTYDILKRTLLYLGYTVTHICNLTDVDDKIIKRCNEQNISLRELTNKYTKTFFTDLQALNIIMANEYPRATDHIDEMAQFIIDLEMNGLAYQSNEGSWYFSVSKKAGYGTKLVQLNVSQMLKGASSTTGGGGSVANLDADEYDAEKEGVRDFCLWKAPKVGFDRDDATWDPVVEIVKQSSSDDTTTTTIEQRNIGKGRPGWHLECSAMARKYLGNTIDLHAGGIDLKFPHHENEIAQSEGANCAPFCNCWIHNGFVNIGDEKMSKSKGNFLTLRTACPKSDDVRAYRYLVVSSQYRNPLSFTEAALNAAKGALKRLDRVRDMIRDVLSDGNIDGGENSSSSSAIVALVDKELAKFEVAIADDLSMPRASACLFSIVKAAEKELKRVAKKDKKKEEADDNGDDDDDDAPLDLIGLARVQDALIQMDQVFGIYYEVPEVEGEDNADGATDEEEGGTIPDDVMDLVLQRTAAKDAKDWELADSLRAKITELGFTVKDVKGGDPIVSKV
ncbi:hypothetical protein ACHAWC_002758 [Mediolabrus comicus]